MDLYDLDIIDTHHHVGSLSYLGMYADGIFMSDVVADIDATQATLADVLFSPYFSYLLYVCGCPIYEQGSYQSMNNEQRLNWFKRLIPFLMRCRNTGQYIAVNTGCKQIHGISLDEAAEQPHLSLKLNESVTAAYKRGIYTFLRVQGERINLRTGLKPVHLGYLENRGLIPSPDERTLCSPILRVDDIMGINNVNELNFSHIRECCETAYNSVEDVKATVAHVFSQLRRQNVSAIKQLQAYTRTINFTLPSEKQAEYALQNGNKLIWQDYIHTLILECAQTYRLPYQIHTGMANLPESNPAYLRTVIEAYPKVNFILLHCYPYAQEAGYLARNYKNVYLDISWLVLQSPMVLTDVLRGWIGLVPAHKIMFSSDATTVEEFIGAHFMNLDCLNRVLQSVSCNKRYLAEQYLHKNAEVLYDLSL